MRPLRSDCNCIGGYALWKLWCPCRDAPTTRIAVERHNGLGGTCCWWQKAWRSMPFTTRSSVRPSRSNCSRISTRSCCVPNREKPMSLSSKEHAQTAPMGITRWNSWAGNKTITP
jgi:hypothetical protein